MNEDKHLTVLNRLKNNKRKLVSILLIVMAITFLFAQKDCFYYPDTFFIDERVDEIPAKPKREVIKIKTDTVLEQDFIAKSNSLFQFHMFFWNKNYYKTNGNVEISILDADENVLGKTALKTNEFRHNREVTFDFTEDSTLYNTFSVLRKWYVNKESWKGGIKIEEGRPYTIKMVVTGVKPEDDFGVFIENAKEGGTQHLRINNEDNDSLLCSAIVYGRFAENILLTLVMIIILAILLISIPYSKIKEKSGLKFDIEQLLQFVMFFLAPFLCFYMTFKIPGHDNTYIMEMLHTKIGLVNFSIIVAILFTLYLIFNNPKIAAISGTAVIYLFLLTCYLLIAFRDAPLRATDFADVGAALNVANNYSIYVDQSLLIITILMLCFMSVCISFKGKRLKPLRYRLPAFIISLAAFSLIAAYVIHPSDDPEFELKVNSFNPTRSYDEFGYVLAFAISFNDLTVPRPEGYSKEIVEKLSTEYESDASIKNIEVSAKTPNIIIIMDEAFSDLSKHGEITTNEPYMPFFNSLKENTVRGTLYPSVFAGGTANTEFEVLTENAWAFLNMKTAYTSLIKKDRPSLARTLKEQGYKGLIAFHPGLRDTYNRDHVYEHFGFNKFISLEDLNNPKKIRQYVSDEGDFDTIISEYEQYKAGGDGNNPFFLFNVTIQNHSAFGYSTGLVDAGIKITDPSLKMVEAEQYLNLIKESDLAFEKLVNYFNGKEPTIIVMFGDHQPKVENEFYDELKSRMDSNLSEVEKESVKYQVPFVIWANYDIEEENNVSLGASSLAPYLLNKLNLKMTGYDKFQMDLRQLYPVISRTVLVNSAGKTLEMDADNLSKYDNSDKLILYNYAVYNNMNDNERIDSFFHLKDQ